MFTDLYEDLINKTEKLSLIGLGYVGMPIAVALAKKLDVIGYDLNSSKIELYRIERESGLKCGTDFKIGYAPERITPRDKVHRLETIKKMMLLTEAKRAQMSIKRRAHMKKKRDSKEYNAGIVF